MRLYSIIGIPIVLMMLIPFANKIYSQRTVKSTPVDIEEGIRAAILADDDVYLTKHMHDGKNWATFSDNGLTYLQAAASQGKPKAVTALLTAGASPTQKDHKGRTPLSEAIEYKRRAVIDILLAIPDINVDTPDGGDSLLHIASKNGDLETVKLLLAKGARVDARDLAGQTPLHLAGINDAVPVAKLLLESGADINALNKLHVTPLLEVCSSKTPPLDMVHLLIDSGAAIDVKNDEGITALEGAEYFENSELVEILKTAARKSNAKG